MIVPQNIAAKTDKTYSAIGVAKVIEVEINLFFGLVKNDPKQTKKIEIIIFSIGVPKSPAI